jgi:hypothetical protein
MREAWTISDARPGPTTRSDRAQLRDLEPADSALVKAGLLGSKAEGLFTPKR